MIDPPTIVRTSAQATAVLYVRVPRADVRKVMGPGIRELMTAVAAQGVEPAGPWFTHHLRMDPDEFEFEISVPVATAIRAAGRVRPGELRAATVARTVYRGPYEGLGEAWGEFHAWLRTQGHRPAPNLWEVYAAGPESGSDPAAWRTELNQPLVA